MSPATHLPIFFPPFTTDCPHCLRHDPIPPSDLYVFDELLSFMNNIAESVKDAQHERLAAYSYLEQVSEGIPDGVMGSECVAEPEECPWAGHAVGEEAREEVFGVVDASRDGGLAGRPDDKQEQGGNDLSRKEGQATTEYDRGVSPQTSGIQDSPFPATSKPEPTISSGLLSSSLLKSLLVPQNSPEKLERYSHSSKQSNRHCCHHDPRLRFGAHPLPRH